MLAFGPAALLGLLTASVLVSVGSLGSCFEGSCGYAGMLVVFPIVTFVAFFPVRKYVARFGALSSLIAWTLVVLPVAVITPGSWAALVIFSASALYAARLWHNAKSQGQDLRLLFLRESAAPIQK
jgi:hypothetical protein